MRSQIRELGFCQPGLKSTTPDELAAFAKFGSVHTAIEMGWGFSGSYALHLWDVVLPY